MNGNSTMTASYAHLLIDARPLNGTRNGIARFVEQLVRAWPAVCRARVTLISNRPVVTATPLPASLNVWIDHPVWRRCPGSLWLTLRGPMIAQRLRATHMLGTQHVLPLRSLRGVHLAVIVHDLVFRKFPATMLWSDRLISGAFVPSSLRRADSIFCISESTRQDLLSEFVLPHERVRVAYPGTTFDRVATERVVAAAPPVRLLAVGSIEPRKNLERLLRAYLLLRRQGHPLQLELVSGYAWGNALSPELQRAIAAEPSVKISTRVDDEQLKRLYAEADFLVFPSLYEGFGLPLLEAIGRCSAIANDIPVFREIANHMAGIRLMDFSSDVAAVATQLSRNLGPARVCGFRDEAAVELFSWRHCALVMAQQMGLASEPGDSL